MATSEKALIVFVDIRGFTVWSDKVENAEILESFIQGWYDVINKNFPSATLVKLLGDGAMIVRKMPDKTTAEDLKTILSETLKTIKDATKDFNAHCNRLSEEEGTRIALPLGWGIVKGPVKRIGKGRSLDYVGANLNKCSRYCDIARPTGIVIDADDFQVLPETFMGDFSKQTRSLKGIDDECHVWVTKSISEQFVPREELRETPEVHVAGICFRNEQGKAQVLLGLRSKSRRLFPSLYEGCGGQLACDELFHEGVARHYEKEYHIKVRVNRAIYSLYEIDKHNEPKIPGVRFLCEYESGTPFSQNHDPLPAWFSEDDFKDIPAEKFIPGLKAEIEQFFEKYKELRN